MSENSVLLLVGPTAVGKTEVALRLAEINGAEIVSVDSRQVYRFLNIGTAKPSPEELQRIPHHFIDIREPDQYYSAGEYGREARRCIAELQERGTIPIVVGGSGFYVRALVDGLFAPKISDPEVKEKWRQCIRDRGNNAVFAYLQQVDPQSAATLHPNDTQRIVRALEVQELSGKPISSFRQGDEQAAAFQPLFVGLRLERRLLCERIERRVDQMFATGLVDEVRELRSKGWGIELNALHTVGYQEVFEHLEGKISHEEMVQKIKINSRRYAKRQMTWFRRDDRINWLDVDGKTTDAVVQEIMTIMKWKIHP